MKAAKKGTVGFSGSLMMNTTNFYRLEHSTSFIEAYNRLMTVKASQKGTVSFSVPSF